MGMDQGGCIMRKKKNQGSSLVEVLVAFAVLMIGLAAFSTALFVGSQTIMKTQAIRQTIESSMEEYYLNFKTEGADKKDTGSTYTLQGIDGNADTITVDGTCYLFKNTMPGDGAKTFELFVFDRGTP